MTELSKAVFLSYASQDAEAAARICASLRAAGVEVWFDQSELRGGDAWDHHIRRQIRDCALFVPIISEHTQERSEGYFRLEWRLADERSHLMGRVRAFIVPVCVDRTLEKDADVPKSFEAVQWTRLPGGDTPPAFCERIAVLLGGESAAKPQSAAGLAHIARPRRTSHRWRIMTAAGVLVVLVGGWQAWRLMTPMVGSSAAALAPPPHSIAVLPFDSLGAGPENSYFADGMTDDIITDLAKLSGILVIARNSSMTYKGKSVKVQQVGRDLGVRYVLEGSVRREGDTVRINAQLVDAIGGQHLWAERYDGSIRDVFVLQDKVIGEIVAALAINLTHEEKKSVEHVETRVPEAYDALLKGWAHYRMGSEEEIAKAIALFEQAIALDPEYGRAHAAVAAASWRIVQSFWESTTVGGYQRAFDRMQEALGKAMRQPNALAYAVSAEVLSKQGRYDEAFSDIDRAMALAPNDPDIYLSKARILNATGRAAQAEESVRRAMLLDPLYSPDYLRTLAVSLFHQKRYEEAVETIHRVLALRTDVADDYITLIASLGQLGRSKGVPEAIKAFNDLSVSAGYNLITVQMFGGWWWYGDIFDYDTAYRDQLVDGLRKAGVPEGAGTDIPLEKYRRLLHKSEGYYNVDGATTIDVKAAKALHDRGVKFVDVRSAKGFDIGHVPGAFNLDVATELSRDSLSRIVDRNEEVVLSCHGKTCPDSAYASAKAVLWGFKHVYYFSGGFPAWEEAGYPVEASSASRQAAELPAKS